MPKRTLKEVEIAGKQHLIRVDVNVPLNEQGQITDDYRIVKSIPTIQFALQKKAKVILMSHLGRPDGKQNTRYSLRPVASRLSRQGMNLPSSVKLSEADIRVVCGLIKGKK